MHRFLLFATLALSVPSRAQQPVPDPHQAAATQANAASDRIRHAEDLLERGDFKAAEPELAKLVAANPVDARIRFDLGFTQEHNGEDAAAQTSYEAAIDADPNLAEPRVALGLLQARAGQTEPARKQLETVRGMTAAPPALRARALRALARLDQSTDPAKARDDLAAALQLTGEQPGDADLTAALAATGNPSDAESTYRAALAKDPNDAEAGVELSSLLQRAGKFAEADALLTPMLAAHPDDPRLVAQAATLFAAEDKTADALALLAKLRSGDPAYAANPALTRLNAHLLLVSGDTAQAEPLYRSLAAANPTDPTLLDDLGSVLVREQKFPEAQQVLANAVAQRGAFHDDAAWGEATGHLAFAASRNHQPEVVLQALAAHATVLPNSSATLFLQATAHDSLHQRKEAERDYRAFLAMADGKLPDEEFEARHRLIALEHER